MPVSQRSSPCFGCSMMPTVVGTETVPGAKATSLFLSGLSGPASTTVRRNPAIVSPPYESMLALHIGFGRRMGPPADRRPGSAQDKTGVTGVSGLLALLQIHRQSAGIGQHFPLLARDIGPHVPGLRARE